MEKKIKFLWEELENKQCLTVFYTYSTDFTKKEIEERVKELDKKIEDIQEYYIKYNVLYVYFKGEDDYIELIDKSDENYEGNYVYKKTPDKKEFY